MNTLDIQPFSKYCAAEVLPVGSKSITNRALMLAAVHGKPCRLSGALFSRDTEIMMDCLGKLGLKISANPAQRTIFVEDAAIKNKKASLFVGNAGTAARFITALAAAVDGGEYSFDSDAAMYERPMEGLIKALEEQGAQFYYKGKPYHFPFIMRTHGLKGGAVRVDASSSSQILSAVIMAGALAKKPLEITSGETVSKPFVEMTRRMASQFPCAEYDIEPDATAASYFAALPIVTGGACIIKNFAKVRLQGDARFVSVIEEAGLVKTQIVGDDLLVMGVPEFDNSDMEVDFNDISDTFLTLASVAAYLPRRIKIKGIKHTRGQETDRVSAMAKELKKLAAGVIEEDDSLQITSHPALYKCKTRRQILEAMAENIGGRVLISTYQDHRIAMSFSVLGCADIGRGSWMEIENPQCVAKTWREFFTVLEAARGNSQKFRVVAIDGGAAVGKSSVSKAAAATLGYMHVDTGAHYRNIAYVLLEQGLRPDEPESVASALKNMKLSTTLEGNSAKILCQGRVLGDDDIRCERINANVSLFAAIPAVREFLKDYQRSMADFAKSGGFGGVIMEGRDIGSVIFPDACARIFLDADEQTRQARRAKEGITDSIKKRDALDKARKVAPLVCPEGASLIDTSNMGKDEVIAKAICIIVNS